VHAQLARLYRRLRAAPSLALVITPGGHSYHERSRTAIFSWFASHLQDRHVPPERIGDIDASPDRQETAETLRVYVQGAPAGNRVPTLHENFVMPAKPPEVLRPADIQAARSRVVSDLLEKTFGAFPRRPPPLDFQIEYEYEDGNEHGFRFAFTSEEGWRLHGRTWHPRNAAPGMPLLLAPRLPGENRNDTRSFLSSLPFTGVRIEFEPRGTGETSWGDELNWHIRRASAWTGRTIASMRVWDTIRALAAVRSIPDLGRSGVSVAARGEAAAIALYAALLDGGLESVFLHSPPPTQNAPSQKDGRGPAIEMLYCLRATDLPHLAGLLFPTRLILTGDIPDSYAWAQEVYRRLGAPDKFERGRASR